MKEKIYTIPVNEAYETAEECPLCFLEKKLEDEALDYALGAAMMEPDYRVKSNETGYCNRHFECLNKMPNKLSLALVLETHLEEIRKTVKNHEKAVKKAAEAKSGLFKKTDKIKVITEAAEAAGKINSGCMICEKVSHTMDRYFEVLFYLWDTEEDFRKKFDDSKGVCMHHFEKLVSLAPKYLNEEKAARFVSVLIEKQSVELERLQDEIHRFTLKFDYRNKDMELGTAHDAPGRLLQKIGGYVKSE